MHIGTAGIKLIEAKEGFKEKMYYDAVGLPTIGYGTLIDTKEEEYLKTKTITRLEAEELLKKDVTKFEQTVNNCVKVPLTQNQFDAILCLVYNIGPTNFRSSSVLASINSKDTAENIKKNWAKWNKGDGKVLKGLVTRRQEELALFFVA